MTLIKVSEARTILETDQEFISSLSDLTPAVFLQILNAINRDYFKRMFYANPQKLETQATVSSGSSQEFSDIYTINHPTGGVFYLDDNGNVTSRELPETSEGSSQLGFYFKDKTIYFTPLGTTAVSYMLKRIDKTPTLDADDDDTLIDEINEEFLKRAMMRQLIIWNSEGNLNLQDALYREELDNLILAPSKQHGLETNSVGFAGGGVATRGGQYSF